MKKIKNILIKLSVVSFILSVILYILFLTVVPQILSSPKFLKKVDAIIEKKTGIIVNSENINVKTYPSLCVNIFVDKFTLTSQKNELLKVKNASLFYDLKKLKAEKIDADYIYLNQQNIKNAAETAKHKKDSTFRPEKLPVLSVKNVEIWIDKGDINSLFINIDNVYIIHENGKIKCTFQAEIISKLFRNLIHAGRNGYIYIENNKLYADNLEILIGVSSLKINGKLTDKRNKYDFTLRGEDIPISDVAASLLYFQKLNNKEKKFMENFYDYSGKLKTDLRVTNNGITGECNINKLSGKSVLFDVPIIFESVPVKFNGKEVSGGAFGILGGEKVYADFMVSNISSIHRETKGTVQSVLTNKSAGKYVPNALITGKTETVVNWHIQDKKIDITYLIRIPKDSDIYYMDAYLGLKDKEREITVKTIKYEDNLEITNYEYLIKDKDNIQKIIMGKGLFKKQNGHFTPSYITCKTENEAPVSVAASFYKYLEGGVFKGNLKYDFHKNIITGTFNVKNSVYKDYKIHEAMINADNSIVNINVNGDYKKSPFNAHISGLNDFNNKIHIYDLYLFLDNLVIPKNKKTSNRIKFDEKTIKSQSDNFDIDLYKVKLNKLHYKNAIIINILLTGSIKDNIFNFDVPHADYAKGILCAKGNYNFNKRTSDVLFSAKNIDSNIVAEGLFNLTDQIQGTANAVLKTKTKNGIDDKISHIDFTIKQGYLPKLGSTEFMFKHAKLKKKNFTLQDAVNIDVKNMKALASDINGSFDSYNGKIKNAHITSSQKYLSLLIKGDYDTEYQNADIHLFGKYNNKKISKIKIFHVPLSFVIKILFRPEKTKDKYKNELKSVPNIEKNQEEDISAFRVKLKGNINKNDLNVEMKSIL